MSAMPPVPFTRAMDRLLSSEGGYVNNPADPGGETNWGIAKRSYPHVNIKDLTRAMAIEIYRNDFWHPIGGDTLPFALGFQLLDAAVNSGIGNAIRWLQRAVNVADDGHWGPASTVALASVPLNDVLLRFLSIRLRFMTMLTNWPNASRGWARRIADDLLYAAEDN